MLLFLLLLLLEVHSTHCESEKRGEIQKNHPCATIRKFHRHNFSRRFSPSWNQAFRVKQNVGMLSLPFVMLNNTKNATALNKRIFYAKR